MHPNIVKMYEEFKQYDQGGTGTVRDEVFLRVVRDASGEVPSVETLLPQFRSKVYPGRVDYLAFLEHLNVLVARQVAALKDHTKVPTPPHARTPTHHPPPTNFEVDDELTPLQERVQTQVLLHQRQQHTPTKHYPLPVSSRRSPGSGAATPRQSTQTRDFLEPCEDDRPSVIPIRGGATRQQLQPQQQPQLIGSISSMRGGGDVPAPTGYPYVQQPALQPVALPQPSGVVHTPQSTQYAVAPKHHVNTAPSINVYPQQQLVVQQQAPVQQMQQIHQKLHSHQPQLHVESVSLAHKQYPVQPVQPAQPSMVNQSVQVAREQSISAASQVEQVRELPKTSLVRTPPKPDEDQDDLPIRALFNHLDADGDGVVTFDELYAALKARKVAPKEADYEKAFKQIDTRGVGFLGYQQFSDLLKLLVPEEEDVKKDKQVASPKVETPSRRVQQQYVAQQYSMGEVSKIMARLQPHSGRILQLCNQQDATRNGRITLSKLQELMGQCGLTFTHPQVILVMGDRVSRTDPDPVIDYIDLVSVIMTHDGGQAGAGVGVAGARSVSKSRSPSLVLSPSLSPPPPAKTPPQRVEPTAHRAPRSASCAPRRVRSPSPNMSHSSLAERQADVRVVRGGLKKLLGTDAGVKVTAALEDAVRKQARSVPMGYMRSQDFSKALAGLYKANGAEPIRNVVAACIRLGKVPFTLIESPTKFEAAASAAALSISRPSSSSQLVDYRYFLAETRLQPHIGPASSPSPKRPSPRRNIEDYRGFLLSQLKSPVPMP
eukprot:TRINITY_DN2581_c0_g1_i1.p1 TRINITY_DN2581_c0_g1~~TRINITY_DN2581_c0_g1_i1.p1  ORF type:complete len:772 (+),score=134.41 TRINITY_DN2581_c0_g1_i1:112-2427(+)